MRIAMFSDIHGNSAALEAVLRDIEAMGGVDEYWVLGDLVAYGHDPVNVLERLNTLPNAIFTYGNTDHNLMTGARPYPTFEDALQDISLIPQLVEVAQNYSWTQGAITTANWFDWLTELPLEHRLTLPDGTRVLGVHAAPGMADGEGIKPMMTDDALAAVLEGCEADLVIVGHTHWPLDRTVNGIRVINMGCVSLPCQPDLRASYITLDADESGHEITFHRADYDRQAVIEMIRAMNHPAAAYLISFMEGKWYRKWSKNELPSSNNGV